MIKIGNFILVDNLMTVTEAPNGTIVKLTEKVVINVNNISFVENNNTKIKDFKSVNVIMKSYNKIIAIEGTLENFMKNVSK